MRHFIALGLLLIGAAAGATSTSDPAAPAAATPTPVAFTWQHRRMSFSYFGITVLYTCDALESQVGRILSFLGARGDLKVSARGCPGGADAPSRNAWVDAEFDVPAAADDQPGGGTATATATATAQWIPVDLTPRHPNFMSRGDCELMEDMRDAVIKNFSIRNLTYSTSCFPHELTDDGYAVTGQALKVKARKTG